MSKRKSSKPPLIISALAAVIIVVYLLISNTAPTQPVQTQAVPPDPSLKVYVIDVGRANSILITAGSVSMLIDAGTNKSADTVVDYIKNRGIKKLDYVIGTHPHEDHIGGMDAVISTFDVDKVILPDAQSNTKTFEDVLNTISNKGLKVTSPVPGTTYSLGNAGFTVLAPNRLEYGNLNNYSIAVELVYGNTSFLFMGGAALQSENEILESGYDIRADYLKVGHHGSGTSTSDDFLSAADPKYAVISIGKHNDYGHPAAETLQKLADAGIKIYRTDESGTITASNGNSIIIAAEK